jgi:hypothetical protein
MAETYQKLVYDDGTVNGKKVQVQSAIEDSYGNDINSTYLKKTNESVKWSAEVVALNSESGSLTKALNSVPSGVTPRIVQVFIKSTVSATDSYALIQTDATLQVSSNVWYVTLNKAVSSGDWYIRVIGW